MRAFKLFFVFLILNFGALGLGSWLMNNGPKSLWYADLNKAPWTPDGWVFGAAWFTIMFCFSIYMTYLYLERPSKQVITLFGIQLLINTSWNYLFFNQHLITIGLINIVMLLILITTFLVTYYKDLKIKSMLIVPYFLWLIIATSLNLYIFIYN